MEFLENLWSYIWGLLNTGFGTALIGAFAGAAGANWFASKKEQTRALAHEVRATNSATQLAAAIANHSLGFKDQIGKQTITQYFCDRDRYIHFLEDAKLGRKPGEKFHVEYTFGNLKSFEHNSSKLVELVLHEISDAPEIGTIALHLEQTLNSFDHVMALRNAELVRLEALKGEKNDDEFAHIYFGIETNDGLIDERLKTAMEGFRSLLEDIIFFSIKLSEKTCVYATAKSKKFGKRKSLKATTVNFGGVDKSLLPDKNNYPDFNF